MLPSLASCILDHLEADYRDPWYVPDLELASLEHIGTPEGVWECIQVLEDLGFFKVIARRHWSEDELPESFSLMVPTMGLAGLKRLAAGKLKVH